MRAVPVETTPGYRARIRAGVNDADFGDNWTELAVSNQADLGRRICETLVENQIQILTGWSLHARIDRPCGADPLAPIKIPAGEYILIAETAISDVALLLQMPWVADDLMDAGKVTLTDFTRFPSKDECQKALPRMETHRQQDQAGTDEAGRGWLEDQVRELQREAKQACEENDQVESRCAALPGGKAEVESACRTSTKSKRCEDAQQRAMERSGCEVEQDRTARSCKTVQSMLEAVRNRLAAPQDLTPNKASALVCRKI